MPMILDYLIGIFRFFLSKYVFITQNLLRKFIGEFGRNACAQILMENAMNFISMCR